MAKATWQILLVNAMYWNKCVTWEESQGLLSSSLLVDPLLNAEKINTFVC